MAFVMCYNDGNKIVLEDDRFSGTGFFNLACDKNNNSYEFKLRDGKSVYLKVNEEGKFCSDPDRGESQSLPFNFTEKWSGGQFRLNINEKGTLVLDECVNRTRIVHELSPKGIYTCKRFCSGTKEKGKQMSQNFRKLVQELVRPEAAATDSLVWMQKLCQKNFYTGTETRWDMDGNVIYHATKWKEDTKIYLVKQMLAEAQVAKSDELRANGGAKVEGPYYTARKRTVVPKMAKLQKAVKVPLAKLKAQKMLRERRGK